MAGMSALSAIATKSSPPANGDVWNPLTTKRLAIRFVSELRMEVRKQPLDTVPVRIPAMSVFF